MLFRSLWSVPLYGGHHVDHCSEYTAEILELGISFLLNKLSYRLYSVFTIIIIIIIIITTTTTTECLLLQLGLFQYIVCVCVFVYMCVWGCRCVFVCILCLQYQAYASVCVTMGRNVVKSQFGRQRIPLVLGYTLVIDQVLLFER